MSVICRTLLVVVVVATAVACPQPPSQQDAGTNDVVDAGFHDAGPRPDDCDFELPTACPDPAPGFADVEPIFIARCQICHSPEGGEWPLTTHGHIADWSQDIRDLVSNCSMPPPDAGVPMTTDERVDVLEWLLCGLPE